jgi:hypothetical protein
MCSDAQSGHDHEQGVESQGKSEHSTHRDSQNSNVAQIRNTEDIY